MTKKSADINYISRDLFPKTYNRTMIDDDYIKQLEQENQQLKELKDKTILAVEKVRCFCQNESDYMIGAAEIIAELTIIINTLLE